jgi:selenocysteine lyase/cysteine desulfurase
MTVSRREFLAGSGVLAASLLAPGRLLAAVEKSATPMPSLSKWSDVRAQFALDPAMLHFSSFYLASNPKPVRAAIEDFRRALDANPYLAVERRMFEPEMENVQKKVREEMAAYLGGREDEIAFVPNTTTGLALVYHGLTLHSGDELLTTTHDHYSHHESIRMAAERSGVSWRKFPLYDQSAEASVTEIVDRVRRAVKPETRVLGVTWVHSSTGVRLPIRAIADALAEINRGRDEERRVVLVVDGVHGLGCSEETVADLGADFFCAGTHKWMFGPRGTGIVRAEARNWAKVRPQIPTFSEWESFEKWMAGTPPASPMNAARFTPGGFFDYEHQWAMGAAFRFHQTIGRSRVAQRIREMNDQLKSGLAKIAGVTVHTPKDPALSAGISCFEIQGVAVDDVVKRLLERKIIASGSPYRTSYPRLAPSLVNTPEEVETALRAVRTIAGA